MERLQRLFPIVASLYVLVVFAGIFGCGGGGGSGGGGGGGGGGGAFSVTYNGNGNTGGSAVSDPNSYSQGQLVTVLGQGTLARTGYSFGGWNTAVDGSGTNYVAGQTFAMGAASLTLYAHWTVSGGGSITVTYNANGATGGSVPADANSYSNNQTVTVLGNTGGLVYSGYTFVGWQTKADGSGTTYAPSGTFTIGQASVTLYALWAGGYAYAANHNEGSEGDLSQFWIGPNGALTPMYTPVVDSNGTDPRYLTVDPSGKYLYVSNITAENIGQFTIGPTGALTAMTPTTVSSTTYPSGIAVDPSGKYVYVADNQNQRISEYTIGGTGALTASSTVVASNYPDTIKVDPSGKYAYLTLGDGDAIAQYSLGTGGALAALSPPTVATASGTNMWDIAIAATSSGEYLYATAYDTGAIWEYQIQANGTLSYLATIPTVGGYGFYIAVHPSGKWAYVSIFGNLATQVIAQFNIGSSGTLSFMSTQYVSAGGTAADGLAIEASGKYLYATSGDTGWGNDSIAQFTINQTTGALTLMSNPTVNTGAVGPSEIVTVGN